MDASGLTHMAVSNQRAATVIPSGTRGLPLVLSTAILSVILLGIVCLHASSPFAVIS